LSLDFKKASGLSVSQLIRQVRLKHAMELLKQHTATVSEVSYQVGFSSPSYFIKCFREQYGYPPGEAEKRAFDESEARHALPSHRLTAIMFTDIEGYTALMQHDETQALRLRNRHREVFIGKALFYLYQGDYAAALPHLEKALEYNPNSAMVINLLADYYTRYVPNTEKYLEYALKGNRLDIAVNDSTTTSFSYLHIASAFIQSGFVDEAETFINKLLDYHPENLYAEYVKAFILYAQYPDLARTKASLAATLDKDPSRPDVIQEVAKVCYFMGDYQEAYEYYRRFTEMKAAMKLDIYPEENAKIAMVMRKTGRAAEAENTCSNSGPTPPATGRYTSRSTRRSSMLTTENSERLYST